MQVPLPPIVMAPTHDSPVAHGIERVQLAPATPSVMQDMAMPIEPGVVKQVWPRAQVPLLVQSAPEASACPQVPQAASVRPVQ